MVIPLPSPGTPHGDICRATRRAGPVFCAMPRYSSFIWNHQTSLLLPCLAQKTGAAADETATAPGTAYPANRLSMFGGFVQITHGKGRANAGEGDDRDTPQRVASQS